MKSLVEAISLQQRQIVALEAAGLELFDLCNVADAHALLPEERDGFTVHFSNEFHDLVGESARFFFLRCRKSGRIVGTSAIRIENTHGAPLKDYLANQWGRLYRTENGGSPVVAKDQPRLFSEISGRLGYIGATWIHDDYRHKGHATRLMHFAMVAMVVNWSPDWVYCWMTRKDVGRGNGIRWGFTRFDNRGLTFDVYPERWPTGLALCAVPRDDYEAMFFQVSTSEQ